MRRISRARDRRSANDTFAFTEDTFAFTEMAPRLRTLDPCHYASPAGATIVTDEMITSAARPVVINREVVGTITVTSVLIVYDGWASLKVLDAVAVIVGPVLAMFIAHVFADAMAAHAARGKPLSKSEMPHALRAELGWLWLAAPPTALLLFLSAIGVALGDSIRAVIWLSAASLGFWAGLAGRRAGLRGGQLALAVVLGLFVGAAVLMLQVLLQPGQAVSNGVAAVGIPTQV